MKRLTLFVVVLAVVFSLSCSLKSGKKEVRDQGPRITFMEDTAGKRIDVMIDGKPFTSYRWPDNVCKPVLYPVITSNGTEITRGFPIDPKAGERVDHPHQIGMWFTYGNVNGSDFWGNGSGGLGTRNPNGGIIKHLKVDEMTEGAGEGILVTSSVWEDKSGIELLKENTRFHFIAVDSVRIIDRITTLTAGESDVSMPDTKEGMFGLRVARQLELPSRGDVTLYSADGHPTLVKAMPDESISGNYRSSEGATGETVWGTRARWMDLSGKIGEEKISLVICDHPRNPGYPTHWHARGYGLFSANPLGVKDFTQEKETMNYSIPAGASATFRYRVIICAGSHLSDPNINAYADDFAGKY